MRNDPIQDLAAYTEFRQTLEARPPRVVHGTVLLLSACLGAALAWAALTRASLVVRAAGRVRPVSVPAKVVNGSSGEAVSAGPGGRVVAVNVHEGDRVKQGDILVRLDTERLDIEAAKRQRTVQAAEDELAQLSRLGQLQDAQFQATKVKAEAELAQAQEEVRLAGDRRASDIRLAEAELRQAEDEADRTRTLLSTRAASASEWVQAQVHLREAGEKLEKARLPAEAKRVEVARLALELAQKENAVRCQELTMKRATKQAELETARLELANLELERKQAVLQAPTGGVVVAGDVKVGDVLERGKAVLEIAEENGFVFEAAVPSEEVGSLRVGLPVRVKLDAYDYQKYGTLPGQVTFIAPDSSVADEPGGKHQTAYLVRVALDGDEVGRGGLRGKVKLGMAGQAEMVTGEESILAILLKKIRQSISLG
jgi:HlyD family secretion protein